MFFVSVDGVETTTLTPGGVIYVTGGNYEISSRLDDTTITGGHS